MSTLDSIVAASSKFRRHADARLSNARRLKRLAWRYHCMSTPLPRHGGRSERRQAACKVHMPTFDASARCADAYETRRRFPRFHGSCDACGFSGVAYASFEHYIAGDWYR